MYVASPICKYALTSFSLTSSINTLMKKHFLICWVNFRAANNSQSSECLMKSHLCSDGECFYCKLFYCKDRRIKHLSKSYFVLRTISESEARLTWLFVHIFWDLSHSISAMNWKEFTSCSHQCGILLSQMLLKIKLHYPLLDNSLCLKMKQLVWVHK